MKLGKYTVRIVLRADNPAFPRYLILLGEVLIGEQFSVPCESDCHWHECRRGVYAEPSEPRKYGYTAATARRKAIGS